MERFILVFAKIHTFSELICSDMLKRYISKYISSADSNCNEFCAGCRTALSRFCVLLTGSYGDSIWLQAVLYASGGYVSRRDSFASYTCVYTRACLNLSITSFEKVAWSNARIETLLYFCCKISNHPSADISNFYSVQSLLLCSYLLGNMLFIFHCSA